MLVTGYSHTDAASILRGYGYQNVHTLAEFAACHPQLIPGPHERYPPAPQVPAWARERVAAVMLIETPVDWHQDLQLIVDLVRHAHQQKLSCMCVDLHLVVDLARRVCRFVLCSACSCKSVWQR